LEGTGMEKLSEDFARQFFSGFKGGGRMKRGRKMRREVRREWESE
jgi:hypothetical protein